MYFLLVALFQVCSCSFDFLVFVGDFAASTKWHIVIVLKWGTNNSFSSFASHMKAYQCIEYVLIEVLVHVYVCGGLTLGWQGQLLFLVFC